ncbi:helix-turn-helix transcriptional regulator [Enterobacter bugandensis]|uniref:helix-turn-helix transcriptional regulator n=1 Tax=Enterobacter bugandensis TaxID=881260 RepID=UPI002A8074E8|nr:HTH domain-containing protein [Enterobacter bugandensis]
MKVIFFGKDRYYAEGLCILLEELYKKQCHSVFFNFNEASLLMEKLNKTIYDLFIFDLTSYGANELRYIDRVIASQFQKRVCIIDDGINNKNPLSHEWWAGQQAISKSWPVVRVKNKLTKFKNEISKGAGMYCGGGLKTNKINGNEIRLIMLLSHGISVKNIARRLNVSDKTLYHQISIIKRKIGLERKNQFLTFLSSFHLQDGV